MAKRPQTTFTDDQQAFLDMVKNNRTNTIIILTGEGGSGKTHTIAALGQYTMRHVSYLCPTHQAKTVLAQRLRDCGVVDPDIATIASFLKKRPDKNMLPDEDDILGLNFQNAVEGQSIMHESIQVVDEASMLSLQDLDQIAKRAWNGVLVICGDFSQLKPPKDVSIWGALMKHGANHPNVKFVELRQNLRASSPQLVTYLNRVRASGEFPADNLPDDGSVTYVHDRSEFDQMWIEALKQHGQQRVVRLAYTNKTVDAAAARGRAALGYSGRFFGDGEIVRIGEPYEFLDWREAAQMAGGRSASKDEIKTIMRNHTVQNGDLVQINNPSWGGFEEQTMTYAWTPGCYAPYTECSVEILTGECKGHKFKLKLFEIGMGVKSAPIQQLLIAARKAAFAAASNDWKAFSTQEANALKATCSLISPEPFGTGYWIGRLFWAVRSSIMVVSSALSMTTHKAQGTGVDYVFVDSLDMRGPEASELKYTAASRTREKLVVLV